MIKPADKGGAVLVQNTTDYIAEAKSQLNDRKYYHQVDHDLTEEYTSQVNQYLIGLSQKRELTYQVLKRATTEKWKPHNSTCCQKYTNLRDLHQADQ